MYLQKLRLKNFRNYKFLELEFDEKLNIFIGENGQGKTNILESIFFSFILKSHRTNKTLDLIKFEEQQFDIELLCKRYDLKTINVNVTFDRNRKKTIFTNNIKIQKISDFIGCVKVVMFSPEDLKIVKESSQIRRRFLDMCISQVDKMYLKTIINYNHVLNMKNSLLKSDYIDEKLLDVYDYQISNFSELIINKRFQYLNQLNKFASNMHNSISMFNEELNITYNNLLDEDFSNLNSAVDIKNRIFDILKEKRKLDKLKKISTIGVHKEDFIIFINNKKVSDYSSQGQQRSAIISIKLGIVELIKNLTKEYPILLLDDILSELDKKRREFVVNFIKNAQTFITNTDLQENIQGSYKVFNIYNGKVL